MLTVGKLAGQCGLSADTIRYYERMGILPQARRGANGYRFFQAEAVQRVGLIQRALEAGFTIADLQRVLKIRDRGGAPCRQVLAIAETRLAELDARIRALSDLRRDLDEAVKDWRERVSNAADDQRLGLLDMWAQRPRAGDELARSGARNRPASASPGRRRIAAAPSRRRAHD
jgi:DNA-binding transcriptional MerR regulator